MNTSDDVIVQSDPNEIDDENSLGQALLHRNKAIMKQFLGTFKDGLLGLIEEKLINDKGEECNKRHSTKEIVDVTDFVIGEHLYELPRELLTDEIKFKAKCCKKCGKLTKLFITGMNCKYVSFPQDGLSFYSYKVIPEYSKYKVDYHVDGQRHGKIRCKFIHVGINWVNNTYHFFCQFVVWCEDCKRMINIIHVYCEMDATGFNPPSSYDWWSRFLEKRLDIVLRNYAIINIEQVKCTYGDREWSELKVNGKDLQWYCKKLFVDVITTDEVIQSKMNIKYCLNSIDDWRNGDYSIKYVLKLVV